MRKNLFKYLCGLVLLLTGVSSQAQIINGGFETGTFTGWTTNANATVVTGFNQNAWSVTPAGLRMAQIAPTSGTTRSSTETFLGLTQGALTTLNPSLFNTSTNFGSIKQSVTLLAGQNITIYWNYVSQDYSPFNDGVFASLVGPGGYQQTKLLAVTTNAYGQPGVIMTGSYGSTAWYAVTFTAGATGLYTLGMGCFNTGDQVVDPLLFLDNAAGGTVAPGQPTVTTNTASGVTTNSAVSGGNVTNDGGATVTARGIVYATTPAPTLSNTVVSSGTGTGAYISNMSGLASGTTYFVRAFATNTAGTSYGNETSFTTQTGCIAPTFLTCPSGNINANTNPGACAGTVSYVSTASGTPTPTYAYVKTGATVGTGTGNGSGTLFNKGVTNVTVTATNACGAATCNFTVTVVDQQMPTIVPPFPATLNVSTDVGSCSATNVALGTVNFTDNCPGGTVTNDAPASFPIGTTTIHWLVTDAAGNAVPVNQSVIVSDNEQPAIVAPADVTVSADAGSCSATGPVIGTATASDNCSVVVSNNAPGTFPKGTTIVTWTATDASGNTASATQLVTVNDTEAPSIACSANVTQVNDAGQCGASITVSSPTFSDNCITPVGSSLNFDGVDDNVYVSNGLPSMNEMTIETWLKPEAINNWDVIMNYLGWSTGFVHFQFYPGGQLEFSINGNNPTDQFTSASFAGNQWYHFAAVYSSTDQYVKFYLNGSLVDTRYYSYAIPTAANIPFHIGSWNGNDRFFDGDLDDIRIWNTVRTEADIQSTMNTTLTGNEPGLVAYYNFNQGNSCIDNSANTTATDLSGNGYNGTLNNFSLDGSQGCQSNWSGGAPTTGVTITNDFNNTADASGIYPVGTTNVVWTATDAAGNTSTCTQTVTVTDNENPSVTAPAAVSVSADANSCAATNVTLGNATGTDNCGAVTITNDAPASFPVGQTIVTYTAADAHNNTATATQTVTVTDNQNPTITAPGAVAVNADAGSCAATNVVLGNANAADNCGTVAITNDAPASYPVGQTTVTYTANDGHGNTATATQVVTVTDNQNPTITAPADIVISKTCQPVSDVALGNATTADNCGVATVTNNAPSSYPVGTTTIMWTVTDIHGNIATAQQTVTVVPATITVTGVTTNNTCNAGTSGAINITVANGTAPYTFSWSNGATTEDISGLAAGTYTVNITDSRSCTATSSFTITQPDATGVSAVVSNVKCNGQNNGSIDVTITSGTAPYTYNWGGGITIQDRTNLAPGTYTLVVTNGIGCQVIHTYTITQPAPLVVSGTATDVTCYGNHDGAIDVVVTGGTQPYNYKWADVNQTTLIPWIVFYFSQWCNTNYNWPGSTINQQDRSGLYPGYYWVQATDANGCKAQANFTIDQAPPLQVSNCKYNVTCNGGNNGSIDISVCGGKAPYTYTWSNGATTQDVSGLSAGTYTCIVTDANGCSQNEVVTITQPSAFTATIGVSPTNTVSGQQAYTIFLGYGPQTVQLQASASGGNGGYHYDWAHTTSNNSCVNVSPTVTTTYTLTVTDCKGCVTVVTRTIYVRDVRANNNKINVCHNGVTTAVSNGQVQSHLNHGDQLGACLIAARFAGGAGEDGDTHEELSELSEEVVFSVYPNPTSGVFTVELPKPGNSEVIITDVSGKIVERRIVKDNALQKVQFDLQDKARGVYMIKVINDGQVHQAKITLQ